MYYVLRAIEKPKYAKKNSDDFYWRDRGRVNCEGLAGATKFVTREDAEKKCREFEGSYEVEEL